MVPVEFEWKFFQGFTTLQVTKSKSSCLKWAIHHYIKDGLPSWRCSNDILWGSEDNERECNANADFVFYFAERFPPGRWSFLGLGSERKLYSPDIDRPQGEWDRVAELMMINFGESGHPVFRATSPLSRGTFISNGCGKLSIHFCADGETIETVFRTIISVNQLSIYGAVLDLCDEYGLVKHERGDPCWQDNLTHCSSHQVCVWQHSPFSTEVLAQKDLLQSTKNEWQGSHNKTVWSKFVLMQDSWQQLETDSTSWQRTLKSSYNLQNQWHVVSTLFQGMKIIWPERLDSREHQNWARVRSHNQFFCKVNMEWPFSHGLNKLVTDLIDKEYDDKAQEISEMKSEEFALKTNVFLLQADQRPKQNHEDVLLFLVKDLGLMLSQEFYSHIAYPVSKRLSTLLRHAHLLREGDGAIECWRLKDCLRYEFENSQHWSDEM